MEQVGERLVVSARTGIRILERAGAGWEEIRNVLPSEGFTSVCATSRLILAGSRKGVIRSTDFGKTWQEANQGLSIPYVRWLAVHEEQDRAFAGTEPAEIFTSVDEGMNWTPSGTIAELGERNGWFLPYSPGGGCVRGFDFHEERGYAAVEVGGALWSRDAGETWELVAGSTGIPNTGLPVDSQVHADVHSIQTHTRSPDLVYAPTGGGFYRSSDGGKTWEARYRCYCRAVWVDPQDPDHLVLGPADSVDRRGRIEETVDGGGSWEEISAELGTPWPDHMVERFIPAGDRLLAILSNGEMLISQQSEWNWRRFLPDIEGATAAAYVRVELNATD